MDSKTKSHILLEAARHLGWSEASDVAELARRLELGLPAEDELSVVFNWLGRCSLVHKLDQFPYPPGSFSKYRVPDLLAVFDVNGQTVPVLVEVKKSEDNVLSWTPDYLQSLQRYADLLKVPLLVAWKHMTFWTLFEVRHMRPAKKNFNISFGDAMRESLMGCLAGDFSFSFEPGIGFHLRIRKLDWKEGKLEGRIEEAYFTTADGQKRESSRGLVQLFMCVGQEIKMVETDSHILQSYIVDGQNSQFAHRAIVALLGDAGDGAKGEWRQVLLKEKLPLRDMGPREAVQLAITAGFVGVLLDIHPHSWPAFLPSTTNAP
jgi:Holliday junction resolvase